jgi:hypothetical protein
MNVVRTAIVGLLCLLLPFAIGCQKGPKLVKGGGTVMFKNAPVAGATVTLVYPDKDISVGATDDNGKFTLTTGGRAGAPVGKAKVSVSKVKTQYQQTKAAEALRPTDMINQMKTQGEGMKGESDKATNELPDKYNNPDTSGLEATIPPEGVEDLQFNLVE